MYCDRCGTQLTSGGQFCTKCGKAIPPGAAAPQTPAAVPAVPEGRVRRHIQLLATLWLINGILRLVGVASLMIFGRLFIPPMRGWMGPGVWPFVGGWGPDTFFSRGLFSLGIFLAFFGVLHVVLAWGLFEREPWARFLGLALGFLALLRFPLGTALGIYTLWVLLPENSSREYERMTQPAGQVNSARISF